MVFKSRPGQRRLIRQLPAVVLALFFILGIFSFQGAAVESKLRLLHLAPGTGPVEVWLDGRLIEKDLGFGGTTGYLNLTPENHRIVCKPKATSIPKVLNQLFPLRAEKEYTLTLTGQGQGNAEDQQLDLLIDNCPPKKRLAQLKFMNAVPDLSPMTVSIKYGPTLYEGFTFRTSGGCKLVPPGDYVFRFTETNTGDLLTEKEITLQAGTRYNLFAIQSEEDGDIELLTLNKPNVPEEPPKVFGVEKSVLQVFGAGLLASLIILLIA